MTAFLRILLVIIGALLVFAILSQARGSGLSETFGGGDGGVQHTKRGPEKVLFSATIVLAILFCLLAFVLPFV